MCEGPSSRACGPDQESAGLRPTSRCFAGSEPTRTYKRQAGAQVAGAAAGQAAPIGAELNSYSTPRRTTRPRCSAALRSAERRLLA